MASGGMCAGVVLVLASITEQSFKLMLRCAPIMWRKRLIQNEPEDRGRRVAAQVWAETTTLEPKVVEIKGPWALSFGWVA